MWPSMTLVGWGGGLFSWAVIKVQTLHFFSLTPPQWQGEKAPHNQQTRVRVPAIHVVSLDNWELALHYCPGLCQHHSGRGVTVLKYNLAKWKSSLVIGGVGRVISMVFGWNRAIII